MGIPLVEKFVGFVDILGFSAHMRAASTGRGLTHDELYEACQLLGGDRERKERSDGSKICPCAPHVMRDVDFQLTQVTDAVVVSAEISPAGVINVVEHCWRACFALLLKKGLMCRGYITRGLVLQTESQVFGPGHVESVEREKQVTIFKRVADEKGTPFIQVGQAVVDYIAGQPDACVKEMFKRMTLSDGELTALFPIKRLSHSFAIGFGMPKFDPQKEKANNDKVREHILTIKKRVSSLVDAGNLSAVSKSEHYLRALDEQLKRCDLMDQDIDMLSKPFPRNRWSTQVSSSADAKLKDERSRK